MPFPFINHIVSGFLQAGGQIGQGGVELVSNLFLRRILRERIGGQMLRGKKASKKGVPRRGTHRRAGEGAVKSQPFALEPDGGRKVAVFPPVGKPHRRTFLIGDDDQYVFAKLGFARRRDKTDQT